MACQMCGDVEVVEQLRSWAMGYEPEVEDQVQPDLDFIEAKPCHGHQSHQDAA